VHLPGESLKLKHPVSLCSLDGSFLTFRRSLSDVNARLQSLEVKVRGDPNLRQNVSGVSLESSRIYLLLSANISTTLT
jgi:hypothetical protein